MKLKLFISVFLLMLINSTLSAQNEVNIIWPDSLNTAKNCSYLTEEEKNVIFEMNKIRSNPKVYANYYKAERQFYNVYNGNRIEQPGKIITTKEGLGALDECIAALENAESMRILQPYECLSSAALLLSDDQSKTGNIGHIGSDGSTMSDRIKRYCTESYSTVGENISYGKNDAYSIVMQLMIDDGVPSRGHRLNIMNPDFLYCGVSINTHLSMYKYLCVIDYAAFF